MASVKPPDPKTLPNRLRGLYHIPVDDGLGPLNGSDIFTRDFGDQGVLQHRAAQIIENLEAGTPLNIDIVDEIVDELMIPDDPWNIGKPYVIPIRKEAAERIKHLWDESFST